MSNWKRWPDQLNENFADLEHPNRFLYPDLNDGSLLILACDYSGEVRVHGPKADVHY